MFYFTLICTFGGGLWMGFHTFHPVSPRNFLLLLGIGTTATLAQLAMTRAYREGDTLAVGSLAYSTVIFASLWGIFLWHEILPLSSWMGVILIILSGVIASRVTPRLPAS